ncbi:ubiquinol-cytochrome c reductase iron-sulfur subunit [Ancylomarina sp. 16SWW S1-10-2]|uniref:QcrA and Rieske domain-containing protein n=1 Tax=Ancylomarina sp. 16SWW S1-10-2 TaxID=2499681 RepID=UPI0012AE797C|nr:Rieske (2Fe-2S) protein [Ancylomarina sp. 16SWW S1-10-2]MRT92692.1 Rieske (2Fe-2S) protein [Ancylomarina sp. 16SWW S1-10-2]
MKVIKLKRSIFQRLLGKPATELPGNNDFWSFTDGKITVNLDKANGLSKVDGAVRLEGKGLPNRIILVHGKKDQYQAYDNKCTHMGRRVDPVPGTETVQCCSVNCTTFNQKGEVIEGPTKKPLKTHPVTIDNNKLIITLN